MKEKLSELVMWVIVVFILLEFPFGALAWLRITADPAIKYAVSDASVMAISCMMIAVGVIIQYMMIKDYVIERRRLND